MTARSLSSVRIISARSTTCFSYCTFFTEKSSRTWKTKATVGLWSWGDGSFSANISSTTTGWFFKIHYYCTRKVTIPTSWTQSASTKTGYSFILTKCSFWTWNRLSRTFGTIESYRTFTIPYVYCSIVKKVLRSGRISTTTTKITSKAGPFRGSESEPLTVHTWMAGCTFGDCTKLGAIAESARRARKETEPCSCGAKVAL